MKTNLKNAMDFCKQLKIAGGGWRLPSIIELRSLIDKSNLFPALPKDHPFIGIQTVECYWSGSRKYYNAFYMDIGKGESLCSIDVDNDIFNVWPIRAKGFNVLWYGLFENLVARKISENEPRFTVSSDGLTVTDNRTGFEWLRDLDKLDDIKEE